jgi:hypothetical protein
LIYTIDIDHVLNHVPSLHSKCARTSPLTDRPTNLQIERYCIHRTYILNVAKCNLYSFGFGRILWRLVLCTVVYSPVIYSWRYTLSVEYLSDDTLGKLDCILAGYRNRPKWETVKHGLPVKSHFPHDITKYLTNQDIHIDNIIITRYCYIISENRIDFFHILGFMQY